MLPLETASKEHVNSSRPLWASGLRYSAFYGAFRTLILFPDAFVFYRSCII